MRTDRSAGFTLLETIVALVVLAGAMTGFFAFLSTVLTGADRAQKASLAYDRQMNALELANAINPMETPAGDFDLGAYRIAWTAQTIEDVRQSSRFPSGRGIFKVALYRVSFTFPDAPLTAPVEVVRIGYHRESLIRQMTNGPAE